MTWNFYNLILIFTHSKDDSKNVAFWKPAIVSSTYSTEISLAILTDNNWDKFFQSNYDNFPWVMIDLYSTYRIESMGIIPGEERL